MERGRHQINSSPFFLLIDVPRSKVFYITCLKMLVLLSDQLFLVGLWSSSWCGNVSPYIYFASFTVSQESINTQALSQAWFLRLGLELDLDRLGLRHRSLRAFGRLLTIQNNCGKVDIYFEYGYTTWNKPGEGLRIIFPFYSSTWKRRAPLTWD